MQADPSASPQASPPRSRFFARAALAMGAIVVLSFPLTYFVPLATGARDFHLLHHVHGAAFFAWFALYAWQARLAARGEFARHRETGTAGLLLTGAMLPLGYWMAQRAAELRIAAGVERPWEGAWFNLVDISLFGLLMGAAILLVARHREWHRRLVYGAALCLVAPAATRWTLKYPFLDPLAMDLFAYFVMDAFLVALLLFDLRTERRPHPATLALLALLLPVQAASPWIARSDWWQAQASAVLGAG